MLFKAKKDFSSVHLGNVTGGQIVELSEGLGNKMAHLLEPYDTKVIVPAPKEPAPQNTSASPAAPASPASNAKKPGGGGKKQAQKPETPAAPASPASEETGQ
jgi:hypothetical protein